MPVGSGLRLPKITTKDPDEISRWIADAKLPDSSDTSSDDGIDGQGSGRNASGRRPIFANPYPSPRMHNGKVLKLPELRIPNPTTTIPESPRSSRSKRSEPIKLPPIKLTKLRDDSHFLEKVASMHAAESSRISGRQNRNQNKEIGNRKLSSVSNLNSFENTYKTLTKSFKDVVQRSVADPTAVKPNRFATPSKTVLSEKKASISNNKTIKTVKETEASKEVIEAKPPTRVCPKVFGLDPMSILDSCEVSSDSDSDASVKRNFMLPLPRVEAKARSERKTLKKVWGESTTRNRIVTKPSEMKTMNTRSSGSRLFGKQSRQEIPPRPAGPNGVNVVKSPLEDRNKNQGLEARQKNASKFPAGQPKNKGKRAELIEFLQTNGGKSGGWVRDDHLKFVKVFRAHEGKPEKVLNAVGHEIKHKTAEDIMAHIKWYEQYESLMKANKNELRKWDMERRQDREVIYQMASEGQRNKLENEKRRHEHLLKTRIQEGQRARANLSDWKFTRKTDLGISNKTKSAFDLDRIQKEMHKLAEKIQSMDHPFKFDPTIVDKLKPLPAPRKVSGNSNFKTASEKYVEKYKYPDKKEVPEIVEAPKISKIDEIKEAMNAMGKNDDKEAKSRNVFGQPVRTINRSSSAEGRKKMGAASRTSSGIRLKDTPSKVNEETFSHKLHKEGQKMKRMEIHSKRGKIPHRGEDVAVWCPPVVPLPKKATPSWRKVT